MKHLILTLALALLPTVVSAQADAIDLRSQVKAAHWNVRGPLFVPLHGLFDTLAGELEEAVDAVAERAVTLGVGAVGTIRRASAATRLPDMPEVTRDRALDTGPCWANDGRALYFSSDRTGIANIYAYALATGALTQVTNVVAGAYQPAVSDDDRRLVYVGYTSYGFDLFELDLAQASPRPAAAYADTRPPPSSTDALFDAESRDYDPLPTLYPRSYLLDLGADAWGPQIGLSISGEDVLSFHRWNTRLGVGVTTGAWRLDAGYSFNRSPLGVSAYVFRNETLAGGLRNSRFGRRCLGRFPVLRQGRQLVEIDVRISTPSMPAMESSKGLVTCVSITSAEAPV
jgi:hypothetical protein